MGLFYNIMLGYFFGFALGVGCALAVFYAIYSGGYRKALEHSLLDEKPKRYQEEMAAAKRRAEKANRRGAVSMSDSLKISVPKLWRKSCATKPPSLYRP